jgi:hypothetical protein
MTAIQDWQKVWRSALMQTRRITDKLGMPVDKEVVETVAILRLMGFHTSASCGGHVRRITGGPYVMFDSPKADVYAQKCRDISEPTSPLFKQFYKKARLENLKEQAQLFALLAKFYASRSVPFSQRLTLRTVGYSTGRLECQGASMAEIAHLSERKKILEDDRNEFRDFTEFLKAEHGMAPAAHKDSRG